MQMTVYLDAGLVHVRLSERNLLALLAKLSLPNSKRTIGRWVESGWRVSVTAETDDEHYGTRTPGVMEPFTERAIESMKRPPEESD